MSNKDKVMTIGCELINILAKRLQVVYYQELQSFTNIELEKHFLSFFFRGKIIQWKMQ